MGATEPLEIRNSWILLDTMVHTYAQIAEEAFGQFLLEKANPVLRPELEHDAEAFHEHEKRKSVTGIKTIVFSAMALEAAAYEFATIHLGQHYAKTYLDKLDMLGKWLIIPRLVCGRSLQEDGPAINGLKALVTARNALVHHKSKEWDRTGQDIEAMKNKREKFEKTQVPNAFTTLVLLSLELKAILGDNIPVPLPLFGKGIMPVPRYNSHVENFVHRCRKIHRDKWQGI
jgi:hypothetical protein